MGWRPSGVRAYVPVHLSIYLSPVGGVERRESQLSHLLSQRLSRYQQFKDFQRRILVATNLFGRGMDIERVNIAFNYDMPEDSDTYLHRVSCPPSPRFLCVRARTVYLLSVFPVRLAVFPFSFQVARAGRFGTKGLAITFVSDENDAKILNDVQDRFEVNISELPDEIDISSYSECRPRVHACVSHFVSYCN